MTIIERYIQLQTPTAILERMSATRYEQLVNSPHPQMRELLQRGEAWQRLCLNYLQVALLDYLDFIGRRKSMTDAQVTATAKLLLQEFPQLRFDEVALFFRMAKLNYFGKLFDLNGATLFEWLKIFLREMNYTRLQAEQKKENERLKKETEEFDAWWASATDEEKEAYSARFEALITRLRQRF